jgi:ribosome recycling factor
MSARKKSERVCRFAVSGAGKSGNNNYPRFKFHTTNRLVRGNISLTISLDKLHRLFFFRVFPERPSEHGLFFNERMSGFMSSHIDAQIKAAMQVVLDHLKSELKTLRSGRANSAMLDKVQVDVYGSHMPIKNLASVTVPESRQILITPFDVSNLHAIAKGIDAANIGLNAIVDGKVVRVNVPPMDEAIRKQIAKQCKELGEKSKISMREVRRKYNELVRKQKADGTLSEDLMKKYEKTIQEMTDRFCKDIDAACAEKEKEIMTV